MRPELPSGTVTFLFTDVEGSTKLLEEIGDEAYDEALAEHRRIVREACAQHAGVEVDTQGDAFFFAFPTAPGALAAAMELTEALASGPISVRIGLHTGEPRVSEEGYVGREVHFAARVAATGHGGQIVLSKATAALVDADLTDLGEHRLKDIMEPAAIYQLGEERFPPLKTISNTNLPRPTSSFVGREAELSEVLERIEAGARLLTLTGPGGSGKTRLAFEAATTLVPKYKAGVFWVGLSALRDPSLVTEQISQVLGAKNGLAEHVGEREMLLLLDNLEQVIETAAELSALLTACPSLTLLCTSRELLRVQGEVEYPVPPLASPEAVGLFCERSGLEPSQALAELCARLDDLPLAVELAAARTKALTPAQILQRLSQRLDLLKGGRDADPRQQTLRATIAWSYDLLPEEEQRLFRALSVFVGGCTLEAAEEVVDAGLDTLQSLVEKSLLRFSAERYWMLETIREYARERFDELPNAEALEDRHADYFLRFAVASEAEVTGADQQVWLERLAADHENLRSALERFINAADGEHALRLASSLVVYWFVRGHYSEGLAWLERSLAQQSPEESPALAKALWGAGFYRGLIGEAELALGQLERGLAVARRVDDLSSAGRCLAILGLLAFFRNEPREARTLFEESVEAARAADDRWCLADSLGTLGSILPLQGDLDAADVAGFEGLSVARQAGDQQGVRMSLFGLALSAVRRGNVAEAARFAEEGLEISRRIGDPWFTSYFQWIRANVALAQGDLEEARSASDEALDVGRQVGGALLVVCAQEVLARVEWAGGDETAARRHLFEALAATEGGGVPASYVAAVELTLGRLLAAGGDAQGSRRHLEASLRDATRVGDMWAAENARAAILEVV